MVASRAWAKSQEQSKHSVVCFSSESPILLRTMTKQIARYKVRYKNQEIQGLLQNQELDLKT